MNWVEQLQSEAKKAAKKHGVKLGSVALCEFPGPTP